LVKFELALLRFQENLTAIASISLRFLIRKKNLAFAFDFFFKYTPLLRLKAKVPNEEINDSRSKTDIDLTTLL